MIFFYLFNLFAEPVNPTEAAKKPSLLGESTFSISANDLKKPNPHANPDDPRDSPSLDVLALEGEDGEDDEGEEGAEDAGAEGGEAMPPAGNEMPPAGGEMAPPGGEMAPAGGEMHQAF